MAGIFISYRREDRAAHAGRLYDSLAERFGEEMVFMDVDTLEPGVEFREQIQQAVDSADAVLVIVGPGWTDSKDAGGARRLENPDDILRHEIEAALNGSTLVIPVLVGGAEMPQESELPGDLEKLASRNAVTLSDLDWRAGLPRLVTKLDHLGTLRKQSRGRT